MFAARRTVAALTAPSRGLLLLSCCGLSLAHRFGQTVRRPPTSRRAALFSSLSTNPSWDFSLPCRNLAFYLIGEVAEPDEAVRRHRKFLDESSMVGRVYICSSGVNAQVSGTAAACAASITSVAELKGKTVAVEEGVVDDYLLSLALKDVGLSREDVVIKGMPTDQAATAARRRSTRACNAQARKKGRAGPRMELKPAQPTESMFRASWITQQLDDRSDRSVHHPARCAPWSSASCVSIAARSTTCWAGDRASTNNTAATNT